MTSGEAATGADRLFSDIFPRQERRRQFIDSGWWVSIPLRVVGSQALYGGEQRLDGGYYAQGVAGAIRLLLESGHSISPLSELTEPIYYPGRFKRVYATTADAGVPFLTASQMTHFRPKSEDYLSNNTDAVKVCTVQPNWLLVTRSGTVGRVAYVGARLAKFAITDDALRVQAKDIPAGYLYAYLSTTVGQLLMTKDQYGSAIKHLEPHHLANIPVPLLPKPIQQQIDREVRRAFELRDRANALLDEADELLYSSLGLERFADNVGNYHQLAPHSPGSPGQPHAPAPKVFDVKASELQARLDASFHIPAGNIAISTLKRSKYPLVTLGKMADRIAMPPRFKRLYVQEEYGVPFLRPSQLVQIRPFDMLHISRSTEVIDELRLKHGDVLITTDGTVGRISLVTRVTAGWAGSNNIARVTYGINDDRNGYLAAFLSTPLGALQISGKIYGGVIDHVDESHIASVLIPDAPSPIQQAIGRLVTAAHEMKDEAIAVELAALGELENALVSTAKV